MKTLVVAEHLNGQLTAATLSVIRAALELKQEIVILVLGHGCEPIAKEAALLRGVTQVWWSDAVYYQHLTPADFAEFIKPYQNEFHYVLASASSLGKTLIPFLAAKLSASPLAEVLKIVDPHTFVRGLYAGHVLATLSVTGSAILMTVQHTAFEPIDVETHASPALLVQKTPGPAVAKSRFMLLKSTPSTRPELASAKVVLSGGRGLQSADHFKLLDDLALKLGAAVGASRAAVDAGFIGNEYQIGQTGKVVAPNLYMAFGISGAIQHIAGILGSKVIVAINKDKEAPIFEVADYGLVADLFEVIPELSQALEQGNKR